MENKRLTCTKECKHLACIENTDETGAAICKFSESFEPIKIGEPCRYMASPDLTCGDCMRLTTDFGCITCNPEDSAMHDGKLCIGFEDVQKFNIINALYVWKSRGLDWKAKLKEITDTFDKEYTTPLD